MLVHWIPNTLPPNTTHWESVLVMKQDDGHVPYLLTYFMQLLIISISIFFVFHLSQKLYYRQKMSVPFISRFTTNKWLSSAVPFIKHSVFSTVKAVVCQPDQMAWKQSSKPASLLQN